MKLIKKLTKESLRSQIKRIRKRDKKLNSTKEEDYLEVMAEISRQELYLDSYLNGDKK